METVIVDAGPLVAYLRKDDTDHDWAVDRFKELQPPLRTCDAALSEAFFLLQQTRTGIGPLVALLERRLVVADFALNAELPSIARLLRRYKDVPMSLADACLVRMSERLAESAVFTLDSDFRIYRRHRRNVIALIFPD
jgi:uncharacterized protein